MKNVLHIVGARPNFVKMAPLYEAMGNKPGINAVLGHTGQHYDEKMSAEIFGDLGMPEPDYFLGIGSASHAHQTGKALAACEDLILEVGADLVVVAGDINSTLAGALAAAKLEIPIAHLEAGLRSFDWAMPEEINRVLTDRLSDILLTHSPEAKPNLLSEGIDGDRIHLVGNTMIDSLKRFEGAAADLAAWAELSLQRKSYVLVTLHRPSNVDADDQLLAIVDNLVELASRHHVVFPIHPRTRARLDDNGGLIRLERAEVICSEPVGYMRFLSLQIGAGAILTDSGGIQEEAAALGVPCWTLRANTERPITIMQGTNTLLGDDPAAIARVVIHPDADPREIPLWDGHAAQRAASVLVDYLER